MARLSGKDEQKTDNKSAMVIPMGIGELMRVMATGAGVGFIASILSYLLGTFVFGAILCQDGGTECGNVGQYSMIVSIVIASVAGLIGLMRLRIYRPLLVVIAAMISLWGFHALTAGLAWYWSIIVTTLLFAVAYGLYSWIARLRSIVVTLVAILVLVIISRLMLS